jgi:hypothetical protein
MRARANSGRVALATLERPPYTGVQNHPCRCRIRLNLLAAAAALAALLAIAAPAFAAPPFTWAIIGDGSEHAAAERAAGVTARVVRISWKDFAPAPGGENRPYVAEKRREFDQLHAAGFQVIVDLGLQDTPPWLHRDGDDSRYVDQFGEPYAPGEVDSGDANLVFNDTVRADAAAYIAQLLADLGPRIDMIRVGGGHWGELTYPAHRYGGHDNCYWAFDRAALRTNPVPAWRPGQPSPHGEAGRFAEWYLDQLAAYQNWQIRTVRHGFAGPIIVLYPSWGIRPGQLESAVRGNLSGATSAERNGEVPRGFGFERQVRSIADANVIVASTWLDADGSGDAGPDPQRWSPIHYLSTLAAAHVPPLRTFGENTGHGSPAAMRFTAAQAKRYGLCGVAWFREDELGTPGLATLADYAAVIAGR